MPVLNSIELQGASSESWAAAAKDALREAAKTLRGIRSLQVLRTTAIVSDGAISEYRTTVRLIFEVEPRVARP